MTPPPADQLTVSDAFPTVTGTGPAGSRNENFCGAPFAVADHCHVQPAGCALCPSVASSGTAGGITPANGTSTGRAALTIWLGTSPSGHEGGRHAFPPESGR